MSIADLKMRLHDVPGIETLERDGIGLNHHRALGF